MSGPRLGKTSGKEVGNRLYEEFIFGSADGFDQRELNRTASRKGSDHPIPFFLDTGPNSGFFSKIHIN
jgi:hypothetical protein